MHKFSVSLSLARLEPKPPSYFNNFKSQELRALGAMRREFSSQLSRSSVKSKTGCRC